MRDSDSDINNIRKPARAPGVMCVVVTTGSQCLFPALVYPDAEPKKKKRKEGERKDTMAYSTQRRHACPVTEY